MKKWFLRNNKIISWCLVIVWASIIFIMSSFNSEMSSSQSGRIVTLIADLFNIKNIEFLSFLVRKMAHFTEYFILGLLVCHLFEIYDKRIYIGIILSILYAFSDEVHQLFVSGRHFGLFDVLIDSLGVIMGHIFYKFGIYLFKKN